jgi:hypothetical protein
MDPISDDKSRAIAELREHGVSQVKTSEVCGVSRSTVSSHEPEDVDKADPDFDPHEADYLEILSDDINLAKALEPEFLPDDVDPHSGQEWAGAGPAESPFEDEAKEAYRLADDYAEMSPGEFIEAFFEDFEVGIRSKFVKMQKRRADRRNELPDKEKMRGDIQSMSSGVGNANDAEYIAEEYWAEAQQYLEQVDAEIFGRGEDTDASDGEKGDYVSPDAMNQNQGEWVNIPGQGTRYGRWEQEPDGSMRFIPMQPPNQQPGMQQPGMGGPMGVQTPPQQQQEDPRIDRLEDKIEALSDELRRDSNGKSGMGEIKSRVEELAEAQSLLEDLQGGSNSGGNDEAVQVLQRQLQQIKRELSSESQQQSFTDPRDQLVSRLLNREDLDPQDALALAEKMGDTDDPEVEMKRIEKEMKKQEMEQSKQRMESLANTFEGLAEKLGEGIGKALEGSDAVDAAGAANAQQRQQPGQQPQPQGQAHADGMGQAAEGQPVSEEWTCPECEQASQQYANRPGVECPHCDYSLLPCPACQKPVEVPPADDRTKRACPNCSNAVDSADATDDGAIACTTCDWTGEVEELGDEVAVCGNCDTTHLLGDPAPAGGV